MAWSAADPLACPGSYASAGCTSATCYTSNGGVFCYLDPLGTGTSNASLFGVSNTHSICPTGSATHCFWGTNADGNDFCCEFALTSSHKSMLITGDNQVDVIELAWSDGTYEYDLANHTTSGFDVEVRGGPGDDDIVGSRTNNPYYSETLDGGNGADEIHGLAGADVIYGGIGDDVLDGGDQNDIIDGDAGDDVISGGDGHDSITGGTGGDHLAGNDGDDKLWGEGGDDILCGDADVDELYGGSNDDKLWGPDAGDALYAGSEDTEDDCDNTSSDPNGECEQTMLSGRPDECPG